MSEKSMLEEQIIANQLKESALLIAESISVVIEGISRLGQNMHCMSLPENERYAPYGDTEFDDLIERMEKAIANSKKKTPPIPPKRKNNINNIFIPDSSTLSPQTPLSQEPESDLAAEQKKKKSTISPKLQKAAEDGELPPERWVLYAKRKEIKADLLPIFRDFVLYHSKKNSKMANWYAAWQTWVRNQINFHPECKNPAGIQKLKYANLGEVLEN